MNNVNLSGNHTFPQTTGRGSVALVRHSRNMVVHTVTALSLLGPRQAAPGRSSQRRAVTSGDPVQTSSVMRKPTPDKRRSGVRGRASARRQQRSLKDAGSARPPASESLSRKKKKGSKAGAVSHGQWADGRSRVPGAGSRRKKRHAQALDDFAVVRGRASSALQHATGMDSLAHRTRRAETRCPPDSFIQLRQHNFTDMGKYLDGCYWQVEDVHLSGDQLGALPIGNRTHPFAGFLYSEGYSLRLELDQRQGDALLFGAINNSDITLHIRHSRLTTSNGSCAALVGEMQSHNWVSIHRLHNSQLAATGTGAVTAGLVGATTGARNLLEVSDITDNIVQARARAGHARDASTRATATVSLGLGAVRTAAYIQVRQKHLSNNQLAATAGVASGSGASNQHGQAAAGLLGILGHGHDQAGLLTSRQEQLYDNSVAADAAGGLHTGGRSQASLGYACIGCAEEPRPLARAATLEVYQAGCSNNTVTARSGAARIQTLPGLADGGAGTVEQGLARVNMVSTAAANFLRLVQQALVPGLLAAEVEGKAVAERAMLIPAREMRLFLFSQGAPDLPLFIANPAAQQAFSYTLSSTRSMVSPRGMIDTAGYRWAPVNGSQPAFRELVSEQGVNTLQPAGWRLAHEWFRYARGTVFLRFVCDGHHSALHYPYENLQSLIAVGVVNQWMLITRQRYPGQPDHDLKGLLRLTRYGLPQPASQADTGLPRPMARPKDGGVYLYQPRSSDALLQDTGVVDYLVRGRMLFHLYQAPGQAPQIVGLPLHGMHNDYALAQYDELAGRARLLSLEDGEVNLWMQQDDNDTLLVYNLGNAPALTNGTSWLRWGFDLSQQPGEGALLARAGDWLYSLRSAHNQSASLRRLNVTRGTMDADWQPEWRAPVTEDMRLMVDQNLLVTVPTGTLVDPHDRQRGVRVRVPGIGGCAHWVRTILARHILPDSGISPTTGGSESVHTGSRFVPTPISLDTNLSFVPSTTSGDEITQAPWSPPPWISTAVAGGTITVGCCAFMVFSLSCCLLSRHRPAPVRQRVPTTDDQDGPEEQEMGVLGAGRATPAQGSAEAAETPWGSQDLVPLLVDDQALEQELEQELEVAGAVGGGSLGQGSEDATETAWGGQNRVAQQDNLDSQQEQEIVPVSDYGPCGLDFEDAAEDTDPLILIVETAL
ncbi:MAG: hypothetical protein OXC07_11940 [Kistimonas sp.]|nr:hypothetical protein [Kistimonas sp.]